MTHSQPPNTDYKSKGFRILYVLMLLLYAFSVTQFLILTWRFARTESIFVHYTGLLIASALAIVHLIFLFNILKVRNHLYLFGACCLSIAQGLVLSTGISIDFSEREYFSNFVWLCLLVTVGWKWLCHDANLFDTGPSQSREMVATKHSGQSEPEYVPLRFIAEMPKVRFSDIHGMVELKARLQKAITGILTSNGDSDHYSSNIFARNGILLFGEPGNGKTYFVQALAGEMGLPLISITYGDVASKWVNDTTQSVMKVFQDARAQAPCVLFFDEIDSFISKRDNSMGTVDETNKTTNTILTEIVNLRNEGIVFVGATNFLDRLDQAAIREGRFDFKIEVSPPDEAARCQILIDSFRQRMDQCCYLPRDVQNIAQRWEGYSVKRIQAVGEEIAAMDQEEQIVAITSRHLMAAMRKVQGRKGKLPEATKSLDQLILPDKLRQQLNTIATRMEDFARVEALGGTVPAGLLFFGGPGTGKTETARSLAKASAYAFISTTGNDLINDSREIDRILAEAKDIRPCIIFIDEADDILANRKNSNVTSVTNKLLTAMDGANGKVKDIVYIAATNHPDHIDPAALRGGRFTEKIFFPLPDEAGRTEFIKQWMAQSKAQFDPVLTPELIATIIGDDISISNLSAILQEAVNHMIGRNSQDGMSIVISMDVEEAKHTIFG
ncbi:MAG: AAA family ATPase [Candidatus Saccharibacteria bacterium]|nr:AAA family ATPase [Moraxellaceae bacterium]